MSRSDPIELWGGLECTIARIGDRYRDQVAETGHRDRADDLDRIAALGIRTLRYPLLWEALPQDEHGRRDWSWHDERLGRMRDLGIRPVAGLIHHGSGPLQTSLLDPAFPRLFARHAAAVARRYPWIDLYTPVNEPLTTARFSCLYGHWFPHERNYGSFLRALVNQCRATVLAMRAIRRINPGAKLVQTDDFGRTFSTPAMAYQAEHENERRWLTFDLLFGRVDQGHPWWRIFRDHGVSVRELAFFHGADAKPDIVGINHYLTSERFLDERLGRYPEHLVGGNGRDRYADVEAVRIPLREADLGPTARLREVWARYGVPVAVTETHHGCTRDEQLRWLAEMWRAADTVRREGGDIRAVTLWALFGTTDWNTLLTREDGIYEPGAFDARSSRPRATALAGAGEALARSGRFDHPVLDVPGWWHRHSRFYRPSGKLVRSRSARPARSMLIVDDGSALGAAFARLATARGLDHRIVSRRRSADEIGRHGERVWAVVDLSPASLAAGPQSRSRPLDQVRSLCGRDGLAYLAVSDFESVAHDSGRPAVESDAIPSGDPAGRRSLAREARIRALCPDALIVRTGPLFDPWDRHNLIWRMLADIWARRGPRDMQDAIVSPTYAPDLVHVTLDLLIDGERGIRHLPNGGSIHLHQLAAELAGRIGLPSPELGHAQRPARNTALATSLGGLMPPLRSALDRFMRDCEPDWRLGEDGIRIAAE